MTKLDYKAIIATSTNTLFKLIWKTLL